VRENLFAKQQLWLIPSHPLITNQAINLALCKANINPAYKPSEKSLLLSLQQLSLAWPSLKLKVKLSDKAYFKTNASLAYTILVRSQTQSHQLSLQ
jgi:hypothetical protein